jgi:hypothetical protein
MLKNFRIYYHNPAAQHLIKKYVESCTTCALATKYDIKKITPSVDRTMKPTRPRQYLYADLIPMFKGTFSYILFALDAYSQYVYAIPLKDKTAASVLQGFLAIFGTTGSSILSTLFLRDLILCLGGGKLRLAWASLVRGIQKIRKSEKRGGRRGGWVKCSSRFFPSPYIMNWSG